jgi:hypothetical protein
MSIEPPLPPEPLHEPSDPGPLWKRLGWFVLLWAASVLALSAVAYLIRLWIG